ncbi:hypothetical protein J2T57_001412 [Natronocella acetinitrilica]|uniref:Uncharacterized protein n=1 Tax=Natronocella acetinitrilica TaxID=414046 RepID=A0AAE3G254_9GAMM|nr:hypothetical protein [Natronocella acetinitrilica]MCP1674310.1 hypothetical protein [Natronocella acetinitrilica]
MRYFAELFAVDTGTGERTPAAERLVVIAADATRARAAVIDARWDARLDAASCRPEVALWLDTEFCCDRALVSIAGDESVGISTVRFAIDAPSLLDLGVFGFGDEPADEDEVRGEMARVTGLLAAAFSELYDGPATVTLEGLEVSEGEALVLPVEPA